MLNNGSDAMRTVILAIAAVAVGLAIAYVDSRPSWDDTGLTVVALVFAFAGAYSGNGVSRLVKGRHDAAPQD